VVGAQPITHVIAIPTQIATAGLTMYFIIHSPIRGLLY
jgi:hypothetical protein